MDNALLAKTAAAMVAKGKGILAADESSGTCEKRFKSVNVECTEENRRAYRNLLFGTPGIEQYLSGVILFDETARQKAPDGAPIPEYLAKKGSVPGIKGGWLASTPVHVYPSEMAHAFWTAIWAWSICFVVTIAVSLATKRNRSDAELAGLVYSLTPRPEDEAVAWYLQPMKVGLLVLAAAGLLNLVFF